MSQAFPRDISWTDRFITCLQQVRGRWNGNWNWPGGWQITTFCPPVKDMIVGWMLPEPKWPAVLGGRQNVVFDSIRISISWVSI